MLKCFTSSFVTDPSLQSEARAGDAYVSSTARPDVAQIVAAAVASTDETVGVVVCGPQSMTVDARKAVAENLRRGKGNVKLFVENFGW